MVFEPAPAGVDTAWLMPALLISLGLVLLAAIAWPVRALIRRHYQTPFALEGRARRAWRLSRLFAWLVLLAVAGWMLLLVSFSGEIGRASCRERVCQYVYLSVVAVSLIKKKNQNMTPPHNREKK